MSSIRISELRNSSVLRVYAERDGIQSDPEYQRMGDVWNMEKRQLLIDTILNDFDMPKLYFHELPVSRVLDDGRVVRHAVIDGRQRLESIWGFIEGKFPLDDDFKYYERPAVKAGGMTYADLAREHPQLKMQLDSYTLPITTVLTDDQDLIEEMFMRLNEAAPLNAAEKRNALGGPMAEVIRRVASHRFFTAKIPFSNSRYQHRELAARFLLLTTTEAVGDTKKAYLDNMVKEFKKNGAEDEANQIGNEVEGILESANEVFIDRDSLLRTHSMTVVYFQVLKESLTNGWRQNITREKLSGFDDLRRENRQKAQEDIALADYDLLEFDRMNVQGTNDRGSIEFRTRTLAARLNP